jgi:hypothetical protein
VIESASLLASGAWSAPAPLGTGPSAPASPQVAVDAAGRVQAVWAEPTASGSTVEWATQPAGGAWTAPVAVATGPTPVVTLDLAVDASADTAIGWTTGTSGLPHTGNVAVRHAGGMFSTTQLVQSGGRPIQSALGTFAVAIDPNGSATAAWDTAYAYAASQLPNGTWGPAITLPAAPYASYVSLAVNAGATALVTWVDAKGLESAWRPVGGSWTMTPTLGGIPMPQVALAANGTTIYGAWDDLSQAPRPVLGASWTPTGSWTRPTVLGRLSQPYDYSATSIAPFGAGAIATWVDAGPSSGSIQVSAAS